MSAKKRKQLHNVAIISTLMVLILLPLILFITLWWRGLLPTREELPKFKERISLILHGWSRTELPQADIIGIDVSHYQSNINFQELQFHLDDDRKMHSHASSKTTPRTVDFVMAKATEGSTFRDNYYQQYKQGCRENNILFGAYHFYSLQAPAVEQANNFIQFAQLHKGDLAPVLDVEPINNKLPSTDSIYRWIQVVEKYYDVRPIIYTNEHTYHNLFHTDKRFAQYPFWIARYGALEPTKLHIMWQCTDNGRVGGISGPVDIDIFKGTKADLQLYKIK